VLDTVVVGAGLAGLSAARRLREAGCDVLVLEARERAGGRVRGDEVPLAGTVDAGGSYFGPRHAAVIATLEEAGLEREEVAVPGDAVYRLAGERTVAPQGRPPISALAVGRMVDRIETLAAELPEGLPWLDRMTVAEWAAGEESLEPAARDLLRLLVGEILSAEPEDLSMLHFLAYLRSGGGLAHLGSFGRGAQTWRVRGGARGLVDHLARELRVELGADVTAIAEAGDGLTLSTPAGEVRARVAVVAAPPAVAGRIRMEAPLPGPVAALREGASMGHSIKARCVYDEPFWRPEGLSGWALSDRGPVSFVVDDHPGPGLGVLLAFVAGRAARELARERPARRRELVVHAVTELFGPAAASPAAYHDAVWSDDPYSGGCFAALLRPGTSSSPAMSEPAAAGRIAWAGAELAPRFAGHMEGAILSGRAAADAAIEVLRRPGSRPSDRPT
jgi:monoamine oxidase